jgi:hypothetical protein
MLRKDKAGSGEFKAPRGSRLHAGQDYRCTPGQWVFAPISGILTRGLYVYPQDFLWKGVEIANEIMTGLVCKLFYVEVLEHKIGTLVVAGEKVGRAQDITLKYSGQGMLPHVHMQIEVKESHLYQKGKKTYINPNCFGVGLTGV